MSSASIWVPTCTGAYAGRCWGGGGVQTSTFGSVFSFLLACQRGWSCTVRAPVFGRHQFFGTSEHYGKAHGILLSGCVNYKYTAYCWLPTSSNILILPSQFWQIRYESCWLHCSKCRILVLLWYKNTPTPCLENWLNFFCVRKEKKCQSGESFFSVYFFLPFFLGGGEGGAWEVW